MEIALYKNQVKTVATKGLTAGAGLSSNLKLVVVHAKRIFEEAAPVVYQTPRAQSETKRTEVHGVCLECDMVWTRDRR